MRLDKFVCKSTELTKFEAIRTIHEGKLTVNGDVVLNEAAQVHENNQIKLDGLALTARDFRYILIHKSHNTICSNIDEVYPSLFNDLNIPNVSELHVAGRLDADTTGLVLVTDDGRWSFDIIRPSSRCRKVYRVSLSRPIADNVVTKFAHGVKLQGESNLTLPASLEIISPHEVILTITEGKYHQVKRMFSAVGNKVVSLHREKIGDVSLDVDVGQWRYLMENEVNSFMLIDWPAIIKHVNDPELIYISDKTVWEADIDLHNVDYDESDYLIDSSGKLFLLTANVGGVIVPTFNGNSMDLNQILGLVKAHVAQSGSCCAAKVYAPTIAEAFKIVAAI